MSLVVVTGTPGAGKTTVLKKALEELKGEFEIQNFGDAMFETAEKEGIVKDRDEMRKLPSEVQKRIQKEAARSISERSKKTSLIVDTHCTIKTPGGYLPGLPKWVLDELMPDVIILTEAAPEEIIGRRSADKTRVRDVEAVSSIEEHQQMNRAMAAAYSTLTGATVKIVQNNDNALEDAAKAMNDALR